jgi:hypothetical protein
MMWIVKVVNHGTRGGVMMKHHAAETFALSDSGDLILLDSKGEQVAAYAKGQWLSVRKDTNADSPD